jgi:N-acetylmuramoyl-L-alanine amidase
MHPAARRLFCLGSALLLTPTAVRLAPETAVRSVPSRPGSTAAAAAGATLPPPPVRKIGRTDYVGLVEVARRLDLKLTWAEPGRKLTLAGPSARAELEADTRDISVNGVRVFLGDPVATTGGQMYVSRVDFERCLAPMLRPGHGADVRPGPKVIVLDAGHGGNDPGNPGKANVKLGTNEKTFTLDVARRTRKLLEAEGYRVVMTREDDSFVALLQRAALANIARADVFVSIHFNALANDHKTSGVEVYTFAPRFQRSSNAWGATEKNDTEDYASPGNRFDHWNVVLAHAIHRRFVVDLKTADRGKKLMHLAVLRPLNCPGILLECGFLTSDSEVRKIATPAYRQQIAVALAAGIRDYAATLDGLRPRATETFVPPSAGSGR